MGLRDKLRKGLLATLRWALAREPDEEEGEERFRLHLDPDELFDLVLLMELRDEGTLSASLTELSIWSGVEEDTLDTVLGGKTTDGPLWLHIVKTMNLSRKEKVDVRKALMTLIQMDPENSIGYTVERLANQYVRRMRAGEEETPEDAIMRKAVMTRYYTYMQVISMAEQEYEN